MFTNKYVFRQWEMSLILCNGDDMNIIIEPVDHNGEAGNTKKNLKNKINSGL